MFVGLLVNLYLFKCLFVCFFASLFVRHPISICQWICIEGRPFVFFENRISVVWSEHSIDDSSSKKIIENSKKLKYKRILHLKHFKLCQLNGIRIFFWNFNCIFILSYCECSIWPYVFYNHCLFNFFCQTERNKKIIFVIVKQMCFKSCLLFLQCKTDFKKKLYFDFDFRTL